MRSYLAWCAAVLIFAVCVTSSWECTPKGAEPAPKAAPASVALRERHPTDANGNLVHDYMEDGTGKWRCWYCDKELPPSSVPGPIPK